MQKISLYIAIGFLATLTCFFWGCKKINGNNNNQVIETPYGLYYAGADGGIYLTNDGTTVSKVVFPSDGKPVRAMLVTGPNLLVVKNNLYIKSITSDNFNLAYDSVATYRTPTVLGDTIDLNQSMIVRIADWSLDYTATRASIVANNYTGGVSSKSANGVFNSWYLDIYPAPLPTSTVTPVPLPSGHFGLLNDPSNPNIATVRITSFAKLKHDTLCAYDAIHNRNFYRTKDVGWFEVTGKTGPYAFPNYGDPSDATTASPLPAAYRTMSVTATNELPGEDSTYEHFFYGHYNNRLIAVCGKGDQGAYYSDDLGHNWTHYMGLPANTPLYCISAPFEQVCLIGSANGLYILNVNTGEWQQNNKGLASNIVVRNIAYKENFYKNGTSQKYIYLATNKGIYQSKDMGANWLMTIPGSFTAVY